MKNIIFDIGNVILKYDPLNFLLNEYKDFNTIEELNNQIFKSKEWLEFDRGSLSYNQGAKILSKKTNIPSKQILYILNNWKYHSLIEIESTSKFIKILKASKKYNLYLLSNFHEDAFKYIIEEYPIFKEFDGQLISYQCKYIKPEKEIYKTIIDKYSLNPKETIFIDDSSKNIQQAKELGIKGIVYKNQEDLINAWNLIK